MNDTPHRVIIGAFPPAGGDVVFVGEEDPVRRAMRQAEAELDRQREEAEAQARATVRVDREWLLEILRDLILSMESHRKAADRRGDHGLARALWRGAWERRHSYDALAKDESP